MPWSTLKHTTLTHGNSRSDTAVIFQHEHDHLEGVLFPEIAMPGSLIDPRDFTTQATPFRRSRVHPSHPTPTTHYLITIPEPNV